ncbi:flagellar brake protein [Rubrivivax gelatinosus]|uniref:Flagellar brake protein n=1 Tax=Rubrivivax gelatinosus TaxID=28068 RepID=A0ABS1DTW7_RUBGE|nr:flagellar brake protein [Rubrivivax gelatinosus]MBK1712943.1 flagellar brake protein [Rubrivivax gelatinosus]
MFQDTRPADLDSDGSTDRWSEFRVDHPRELQALLRQLCDGSIPVHLNAPDGTGLTTTLWSVDAGAGRLAFSADEGIPGLQSLVEADEAVAVAYLDSIKLQFELQGLLLVRGARACALQAEIPRALYRFQRRGAYRVRPHGRQAPTARLRHPSIPDMALALRVIDISAGGCALLLPHDVPAMAAGILIADVQIELDVETRFTTTLALRHVTALPADVQGVRLGCEWAALAPGTQRALQHWIDVTQKRRRLMSL